MALDAIATPTLVEEIPFNGKTLFCITGYDTDASTAIEIKAAPGAGKAIYITSVIIGSDDADAHPHLQDEDDNVLIGPLMSAVEGPVLEHTFSFPLKLVSNKALEIKAAAGGNVFIHVEGAIASG
jgi:hypothetical protein